MTQSRTIYGSRLTSLLFTLFCLAAMGVGSSLPSFGPDGVMALAMFCFGLGAISGVAGAIWRAKLVLTPDRFEYSSLFGRRSVRWNDVDVLFANTASNQSIAWRLKRADPPIDRIDAFLRAGLFDGRLGKAWALPKAELLALMEDYQRTAPNAA